MNKAKNQLFSHFCACVFVLLTSAGPVGANGQNEFKLGGTVDVPGDSLILPVGTDTAITLFLAGPGGPPVTVIVTSATEVEFEEDNIVLELRDGDRVQAEGNVVSTAFVLEKLEVEEFAQVKVSGLVMVGGVLPLPVTVNTQIDLLLGGARGPVIRIILTPSTVVEFEETGAPSSLQDNDFVEAEAVLLGRDLIVQELEVEEFAEVELRGTVIGLSAPLSLPVVVDTPVTILVGGSSGLPVQVVITPSTRIEEGLSSLMNDDQVEVEVVLRGKSLKATELEKE